MSTGQTKPSLSDVSVDRTLMIPAGKRLVGFFVDEQESKRLTHYANLMFQTSVQDKDTGQNRPFISSKELGQFAKESVEQMIKGYLFLMDMQKQAMQQQQQQQQQQQMR